MKCVGMRENENLTLARAHHSRAARARPHSHAMTGSVVWDCGGAVNALSSSPDWSHIVVAGRDVLKIVKVHS
jgi:hypothetical protein